MASKYGTRFTLADGTTHTRSAEQIITGLTHEAVLAESEGDCTLINKLAERIAKGGSRLLRYWLWQIPQ